MKNRVRGDSLMLTPALRRRVYTIIKVIVTLLFFYYLIAGKAVTREGLLRALSGADSRMLALSALVAALALAVTIVRWHGFLAAGGVPATRWQSLQSYLGGALLGFLSPGRSGEFARGIFLEDLPLKEAAFVTLAEKAYVAFFIFLFGAAGVLGSLGALRSLLGFSPWIVAGVLVLLSVQFGWIIRLGRGIRFRNLFSAMPEKPHDRLYLLSLSNLVYLLGVLQLYFILQSFLPVRLSTAFVTLSLSLIAMTFFPLSLGNLGVRETCFMVLLSALEGVPKETAVSAGLIFFLQNILVPAALGVPAEFVRIRGKGIINGRQ